MAVYVGSDPEAVYLQVDGRRLELDGKTTATYCRLLRGFFSELIIFRGGEEEIRVRQPTVARALLRRTDPGYDELDEAGDDFLADVADIVNSADRREWLLKVKAATAGPWEHAGT